MEKQKQKIIIKIFSIIFPLFFLGVINMAEAVEIDPEKINGNPNDNDNHFLWDIMAELQSPDDADCLAVALIELQALGFSEEEAAEPANMACEGLASMGADIESGMEGEGNQSTQTNLFEADNWHNVENLYFQHTIDGVPEGRIGFSVPIDFMSYAFMNFMMSFGQNMDAREGYISLNADVVGGFADYGAVLTMYDVPEFENPKILVNGQEDSEGVVSDFVYDKEAGTITFTAAHFSSFEVVESSSMDIKKASARKFLSTNGKQRVRLVVNGSNFNKKVDVKLGSQGPYKIKRKIGKGPDRIEAYFDLDDLNNLGHRKLAVHVIDSDGSISDYDGTIDLEALKLLPEWAYMKAYKDVAERIQALKFFNFISN